MTKRSFAKKIKFATILLALTMVLGVFIGCSRPDNDGHVVSDQINVVDGIYHEVYIEHGLTDSDKGLVVGIHPSAMKILKNADSVYDGENELAVINGRVKGLTGKTLGSENNILTINKGSKEYTLKYMYVTRAISNVNDLSLNRDQFPSAPWINGETQKYTPYIFEMPISSRTSKVPTLKIPGYFVLTADIDIGGIAYNGPGQAMPNTIKAGHAELRHPTGSYSSDVGFTGTFDGRGHTLKNFTSWQGGMFGYINGGTIKNLALVGACNYWQGQDKSIFADLSKDAHFENIYVSLKQQKTDNGGVGTGQDSDGYGWARERWAPLFSKGTIHVKNCVLESFALDGQQQNNTNYIQFLNSTVGSTYENVHCVGSAPLAVTNNYSLPSDFEEGVKLMITEKELEEFIEEQGDITYGDTIFINNSFVARDKYYYVMEAIKPLIENRNPNANTDEINLVQAPAGVERYAGGLTKEITINKFYNAMKNDTASVQAFMNTGCWSYDATTGALTWKNI